MLSFEQIFYEAELKDVDEIKDYLETCFCAEDASDYLISEMAGGQDVDSIKDMFSLSDNLLDRAREIYENNMYCLEAFYVIYRLGNALEVYQMFNGLLYNGSFYDELNSYRQYTYKTMLEIYAEYLAEIHNLRKTIEVTKIISTFEGSYSRLSLNRLAFAYSLLEDLDSFFELYEEAGFNDITQYLLLMIVALKQNDQDKAKEVYSELLSGYEYAQYLDYPKALLKIDDEEAKRFYAAVEAVCEELVAVPDFFLWCARNKEKTFLS